MSEYVYRISRLKDGKWYGRNMSGSKTAESSWHPHAGKFMSLNSLKATITNWDPKFLDQVEVHCYIIQQESQLDGRIAKLMIERDELK